MFCVICGYEGRRQRRLWFAGVWIFVALACLTKGVLGIVYPAVVLVLLSIFYREARIRFRGLLRWEYALIFLLIVAPWHIWAQWHFPHYFRYVRSEWLGHLRGLTDDTHDFLGVPAYQFVIMRKLRDQIEMQVLINVAEEWECCRKNENTERSDYAEQQNENVLIPVRL